VESFLLPLTSSTFSFCFPLPLSAYTSTCHFLKQNHLWLRHATWPITWSFVAQSIFTFYLLLTEAKRLRFPLMLSASSICFRFPLPLSASAFCFRFPLSAYAFHLCFPLMLSTYAFRLHRLRFPLTLSDYAFRFCFPLMLSTYAFRLHFPLPQVFL
jgi:hypothetical protein